MHNEIGRASTRRRADGRSSPVQQDFGTSRRTICYPGGERRRRTAHRFEKGSETMNSKTIRSEEHTSELQSLMRTSYAVVCLKKKIGRIFMVRSYYPSECHAYYIAFKRIQTLSTAILS